MTGRQIGISVHRIRFFAIPYFHRASRPTSCTCPRRLRSSRRAARDGTRNAIKIWRLTKLLAVTGVGMPGPRRFDPIRLASVASANSVSPTTFGKSSGFKPSHRIALSVTLVGWMRRRVNVLLARDGKQNDLCGYGRLPDRITSGETASCIDHESCPCRGRRFLPGRRFLRAAPKSRSAVARVRIFKQ